MEWEEDERGGLSAGDSSTTRTADSQPVDARDAVFNEFCSSRDREVLPEKRAEAEALAEASKILDDTLMKEVRSESSEMEVAVVKGEAAAVDSGAKVENEGQAAVVDTVATAESSAAPVQGNVDIEEALRVKTEMETGHRRLDDHRGGNPQ